MPQVDANTIMIVLVAVINLFTALVTYRTSRSVKATDVNIHKIEVATNSMKDALVKVTGEAEFAKGVKVGEDNARS